MAGHIVTGAAVVLQLRGGGERYLYRGAPVPENVYLAASVKHGVDVGLLADAPEEPEEAEEAAGTEGTEGASGTEGTEGASGTEGTGEPKGSAKK